MEHKFFQSKLESAQNVADKLESHVQESQEKREQALDTAVAKALDKWRNALYLNTRTVSSPKYGSGLKDAEENLLESKVALKDELEKVKCMLGTIDKTSQKVNDEELTQEAKATQEDLRTILETQGPEKEVSINETIEKQQTTHEAHRGAQAKAVRNALTLSVASAWAKQKKKTPTFSLGELVEAVHKKRKALKEEFADTYDDVGSFIPTTDEASGDRAVVRKDGEYGFIDTSGKEVIACEYDYAGFFSEGRAIVQKGEKWGFIDTSGKEVIAREYDYAGSFSEGRAVVQKDGKYGFIDTSGKEVIARKYDSAGSFSEGRAVVRRGTDRFYIDINGKRIEDEE